MSDTLKIVVVNPPSKKHQEELLKTIKEFIQRTYYS